MMKYGVEFKLKKSFFPFLSWHSWGLHHDAFPEAERRGGAAGEAVADGAIRWTVHLHRTPLSDRTNIFSFWFCPVSLTNQQPRSH